MSYFCNIRVLKSVVSINKNCMRAYSIPKVKTLGSAIALDHFDQFYSSVFDNWPSIRLALLCPHSYCAVANVFAKEKSAHELFGDMDVFNMKDAYHLQLGELGMMTDTFDQSNQNVDSDINHQTNKERFEDQIKSVIPVPMKTTIEEYSEFMPATEFKHREFDSEELSNFYQPNPNFKAQLIKHGVIHYPEHWEMYYCPRGKFKRFPPPKTDVTGLLNYYLMDGASLLPVFALDVQKGEDVADLCASPGGKSLAILFGLRFGKLVCNDASLSRVNKLKTVLSSYLPDTKEWSKKILVSNLDVCDWQCFDSFDKILLDVPCSNDRLSVTKDSNNIFQQKRFNERMLIPRNQTAMLSTALKALKVGGSLVYSTCTLSPIQNDGVVHMSLSNLSTESSFEFCVQDLSTAFFPLRKMFQFSDNCIYGQLVVPFLPLNYGPMYICKINRTK
ncbi:UNVERIFIED_CONTAM: nsun4 [Trichonephila clavipes]